MNFCSSLLMCVVFICVFCITGTAFIPLSSSQCYLMKFRRILGKKHYQLNQCCLTQIQNESERRQLMLQQQSTKQNYADSKGIFFFILPDSQSVSIQNLIAIFSKAPVCQA